MQTKNEGVGGILETPVNLTPAVAPWLVKLADELATWFLDSEGQPMRSLAVSDADIQRENVPTLPIALLFIDRETVQHNPQSSASPVVTDAFTVEFWLENTKYRIGDSESAFWVYHDHAPIRDVLWQRLYEKQVAENARNLYQFVSMDVGVDTFAIVLTFRFNRIYTWCMPDSDVQPLVLSPKNLTAKACPITPPCDECCDEEEKDPCQP